MKRFHRTSRIGFNFSYLVLAQEKGCWFSVAPAACDVPAILRAFIAGAFSPFFHSETIKGVGFVTLS